MLPQNAFRQPGGHYTRMKNLKSEKADNCSRQALQVMKIKQTMQHKADLCKRVAVGQKAVQEENYFIQFKKGFLLTNAQNQFMGDTFDKLYG